MKTNKVLTTLAIVSVILLTGCKKDDTNPITIPIQTVIQPVVTPMSASVFAVLAGSTITNTGATTVTGNMGLSPGSAVSGFPPGILNGTKYINDAVANQAKLDLTTAYNDAAGRTSKDV